MASLDGWGRPGSLVLGCTEQVEIVELGSVSIHALERS
jgi:hypothetical protein